jgi:NAD(P)-dependent dehydrogenase (short-subunit alcohol dehydrogenase family)
MTKLEGKVATITGGSSGIGLASAKRFVDEGAYVFIMGRRQAELEKAKAEIGKNVTIVQGDVSSLADLDNLYRVVAEEKGRVDIVMANAGFVEFCSFESVTQNHFDKTFQTNARGAFFTVQKALPLMKNGGSIILVAASGHLKGSPGRSTYVASKAAIRSFARTLALELKDRNIRVNTLTPGATDTPIAKTLFKTQEQVDKVIAHFKSLTPLGRLGRPEEVASAALFLASDDSSYSTGMELLVDGGFAQV